MGLGLSARLLEWGAVATLFVVHGTEPLFATIAAVWVSAVYGLWHRRLASHTRRVTAQALMVIAGLLILVGWIATGAALLLVAGCRLLTENGRFGPTQRLLVYHSLYWGIVLLLLTPRDRLGWIPSMVGLSFLLALTGYRQPRWLLDVSVNRTALMVVAALLVGTATFVWWRFYR